MIVLLIVSDMFITDDHFDRHRLSLVLEDWTKPIPKGLYLLSVKLICVSHWCYSYYASLLEKFIIMSWNNLSTYCFLNFKLFVQI